LPLSSPLFFFFLASFIFRHFADRCKCNERQVVLEVLFYRHSLQVELAVIVLSIQDDGFLRIGQGLYVESPGKPPVRHQQSVFFS
jgi:hypothetical protein